MYLSTVDHISDGSTTVFAVPFEYINKSYVKIYAKTPWGDPDYSQELIPLAFAWQTPNTVQLSAPVTSGWTIRIRRETEIEKNLVRFSGESLLAHKHLDLQSLQHLHLIQELHDRKLEIDLFEHTIADLEERMATKEELAEAFKELDEKKADKDAVEAAVKELKEAIANKADKLHAAQHSKGGSDPVAPKAIGAMPEAPGDGKTYLGVGGEWQAFDTTPELPEGGEAGNYLRLNGSKNPEWMGADVATPYKVGMVQPDNRTIRIVDGVLSVISADAGAIHDTNAAEVQYFVTDGITQAFTLGHSLGTDAIVVQTYNADTGERLFFREQTEDGKKLILTAHVPPPKDMTIRVVIIGPKISENPTEAELTGADTVHFVTDGVSTEYVIEHQLQTMNLIISSSNADTGDRIFFAEQTLDASTVVLSTAEPLEDGLAVRVVLLAAGTGAGSGTGTQDGEARKEFVFTQATASEVWNINHELGWRYPNIIILDETGTQVQAAIDWSSSTPNYVRISFGIPTLGTAIVSI